MADQIKHEEFNRRFRELLKECGFEAAIVVSFYVGQNGLKYSVLASSMLDELYSLAIRALLRDIALGHECSPEGKFEFYQKWTPIEKPEGEASGQN